jgi:ribosomal protein L22
MSSPEDDKPVSEDAPASETTRTVSDADATSDAPEPAAEPAAEVEAGADTAPQAEGEPKPEAVTEPAEKPKRRRRPAAKKPPAAEEPEASEETPEPEVAEDVAEPAAKKPAAKKPPAEQPEPPAPAPSGRRRTREPGAAPPVVRAQAKYVRCSPRKARLVCDHIRGKSVEEARAILAHTPRAVARDWSKLLESAVANAEHNHELVGEDLYVKAVHADEGPTIKRFRPRAMGRATKIRKRTSHMTILLTPKDSRQRNKN